MAKVVKIAISLPHDLLQAAEDERKVRGESRSEFVRHALETHLREARERADVERYIQAYRDYPETEEELAWVHQVSLETLAQEPWD